MTFVQTGISLARFPARVVALSPRRIRSLIGRRLGGGGQYTCTPHYMRMGAPSSSSSTSSPRRGSLPAGGRLIIIVFANEARQGMRACVRVLLRRMLFADHTAQPSGQGHGRERESSRCPRVHARVCAVEGEGDEDAMDDEAWT